MNSGIVNQLCASVEPASLAGTAVRNALPSDVFPGCHHLELISNRAGAVTYKTKPTGVFDEQAFSLFVDRGDGEQRADCRLWPQQQ